jgi:hypothetical protein
MVLNVLLEVISLLGLMAVVAMLGLLVGHRHTKLVQFRYFAFGFLILAGAIYLDLAQSLGWIEPLANGLLIAEDVLRVIAILSFATGVFQLRSEILKSPG